MDDADLDSFFDVSAIPTVDINFRVTYYPGLVRGAARAAVRSRSR